LLIGASARRAHPDPIAASSHVRLSQINSHRFWPLLRDGAQAETLPAFCREIEVPAKRRKNQLCARSGRSRAA
jgi:hypothetical protein